AERRCTTCYAAIRRGELRRSFDTWISEWGNPPSIAGTPRPLSKDIGVGFEQKCEMPKPLDFDRRGFGFPVIKRRYETSEYIGGFKQTQGTETSKYLEERTSTETPLVVASERGPGQWRTKDNRNTSGKLDLRG